MNYDFNIATEFPHAKVDSDRITREIQQSVIVTALDRVETASGICSIWFRATLSNGDVALLATLVAAHSGEPLPAVATPVTLTGLEINRDNRLIVQPVTLGAGQWHYWHGMGDDVANGTVGGGPPFQASADTTTPVSVVWSYRDPVWIAGGSLKYQGAALGDCIDFVIYAPATPITPNGGNTGNCHLHPSGILIPAAGNGAWNVDLTTATPVPTSDFAPFSGFWDYELPADMRGRGVITPGSPGTSKYHLIPARVDLDKFVQREQLLGTGVNYYEPDNIKVSLCLPGWAFQCTLHNGTGAHTVEAIWRVLVSRYWTTM